MDYSFYVQEIKTRISSKELISFYGVTLNSRGFAKCPFHNEKTASFKAYDGDKGFYCFGCGEAGDIISFVQKYFQLDFIPAVQKIDADFNLNLGIGRKMSRREQLAVARNSFARKKEIERKTKQKEVIDNAYWTEYDKWVKINNDINDFAPKEISQDFDDRFVEALKKLSYQEYVLDLAEREKNDYE